MATPRLLPVGVPWRIDPSTPFMRVYASGEEIVPGVPWMSSLSADFQGPALGQGARERLYVTFVGYFGLEDKTTSFQLPSAVRPLIVEPPGEFNVNAPREQGAYRLLRLTFIEVADSVAFRSGGDFVEEEIYDYSFVTEYAGGSKDQRAQKRKLWEKWQQTGLCPDPLMYEVASSSRLAELESNNPQKKGLHHYLLLGHDINAEIIADRWRWEEGQTMIGW